MRNKAFKLLLTSIVLLISFSALAQAKSCFGFGGDAGYKGCNNKFGFIGAFSFRQRLTFTLGYCSDSDPDWGWSAGVEGYILKSKWRIAPGVTYNTWTKAEFYTGEGEDPSKWSNYRVPASANIVPMLGVNRIFNPDNPEANGLASLTFYVSYRNNLENTKVILDSGIYREDEIDRINRGLSSGLGFGVKFIYLFHRNE